MNKVKALIKPYSYSLVLGGFLLMTGCATAVFKVDSNVENQPQMSLSEACKNIKSGLQKLNSENYVNNATAEDIKVTGDGFSFKIAVMNNGVENQFKYSDIKGLTVIFLPGMGIYFVNLNSVIQLIWLSQGDAQSFVDAVMAMKYYSSKYGLADDEKSLVDFQQKANVWRALSQKPPLPEEVHRFIVLKDDAIQNNEFDKAADYYEQALAIDPTWPSGQYNAAMIYGELKFYPMAVMHMKRYLVLEPDAKDARADQDKIYLWEEKAK